MNVGSTERNQIVEHARARLGTQVGVWYLEKMVGAGTLATVYSASGGESESPVAIKILHSAWARDQSLCTRFLREGRLANAVGHRGAVTVRGQGTTESGCPYLVMDFIEGLRLDELCARAGGSLPAPQAVAIALAIADVVNSAHARSIVHGDIKPENVIITRLQQVKLLDFGMTRLRQRIEHQAPEHAEAQTRRLAPELDSKSVGAVLFWLLTGEFAQSDSALGDPRIQARLQAIANAPPGLAQTLRRAFRSGSSEGFPDASALLHGLQALRNGTSTPRRNTVHGAAGVEGLPAPDPVTPSTPGPSSFQAVSAPPTSSPPTTASPLAPKTVRAQALARIDGLKIRDVSGTRLATACRVWEILDSTLSGWLHYGVDHPQARERFDAAYRDLRDLLDDSAGGVLWTVSPFAFMLGDEIVWEPRDKLDWIPYRSFACGVRVLGILPNIGKKELHEFLDLISLDPRSQMSAEDDLVTLLWERDFPNIIYRETDSFSEADQSSLETFERQREAIIASVQTNRSENRLSKLDRSQPTMESGDEYASPIDLEPAERTLLRAQLAKGEATTGERFLHAAAQGYVWARGLCREEILESPLKATVAGLCATSPITALEFIISLCAKVRVRDVARTRVHRAALATSLLSSKLIELAGEQQRGQEQADAELGRAVRTVLAMLDESIVGDVLELVPNMRPGPVQRSLLAYLRKFAAGFETAFATTIARSPAHVAIALVQILAELETKASHDALVRATDHTDSAVQIESLAYAYPHTSDRVFADRVKRMLELNNPDARSRLLQAIEAHKMTRAASVLDERVLEREFDALSAEERTMTFSVLGKLAPRRAEQSAIEILSSLRFLSTPAHETTRAIAATTLGTIGASIRAIELLEQLSKQRIGSSKAVKISAAHALESLRNRADQDLR